MGILSSFGFFGLALWLAKNQMCLMCGGFSFFLHGIQRLRPKKVAGFPPKSLSAVIKISIKPEMSEYLLTAIFVWPVLATDYIFSTISINGVSARMKSVFPKSFLIEISK